MPQNFSDQFVPTLAAVFREAREAAGISQKKLSELSGVGRTGIVNLEAGKRIPSILLCQMLADGLGVSLASLVSELDKRLPKRKKHA